MMFSVGDSTRTAKKHTLTLERPTNSSNFQPFLMRKFTTVKMRKNGINQPLIIQLNYIL